MPPPDPLLRLQRGRPRVPLAAPVGRGDNVVALITHEDNPNEKHLVQDAGRWRRRARACPDLHAGEGGHARMDGADRRAAARPHPLGLLPEHDQHEGPRAGAARGLQHARFAPARGTAGGAPINWAVLHGEAADRHDAPPDGEGARRREPSSTRRASTSARATRPSRRSARCFPARGGSSPARSTPCSPAPPARRRRTSRRPPISAGASPEDGRIDWTQSSRAGSSIWCGPSPIPIPGPSPTWARPG